MNTTRRSRTGNPRIAVSYVRVSTDEQKLGPEAQRAAIAAWAKHEGVEVVATFSDEGVSGGSDIGDRPGLVAALAELRASRAGVLIVAKRDRLARDTFIAQTIERAAKACGAKVATADGVANGNGGADEFMRNMLDAVAQYERSMIRARTVAALKAKRARGERAGNVPYGYTLAADGIHLEENHAEQGVLAVVRELRASGLSLRAIVAQLAQRGIASRAGKPLGLTQVARMEVAA
jgi:DNA invertase Pin-like site-specific DNA recombinase